MAKENEILSVTLIDLSGNRLLGRWAVTMADVINDPGSLESILDKVGCLCENFYKGGDDAKP